MRIWLIGVGEPLPLPGHTDRIWRTGLITEILARRGHEVLWWTSSFDHFRKRFHVDGEPRLPTADGAHIQFLGGRPYRKNVSLHRLMNHRVIARQFAELARREPRPNVILCGFPTIELTREAVNYAREHHVPVVADVCDLWPDIFLHAVPRGLRWAGRLALWSLYRDTRRSLAACDALFAVSDRYLEWGLERAGRPRSPKDCVYPLGYRRDSWSAADGRELDERMRAAGARGDTFLVTFAGTFGRSCDLSAPIEAMRRLEQGMQRRVQLVLCGAGEREGEWRELAKGVRSVVFPGWLPAGQLACLLARSHLGLAAYAADAPQGIPNKVIEYLSAGLPVLSSLDGESRQLLQVGNCGAYFSPDDPGSLARVIEDFAGDPGRMGSMSAAASGLFESRFAAHSVFNALSDDLERLGAYPSVMKRDTEFSGEQALSANASYRRAGQPEDHLAG